MRFVSGRLFDLVQKLDALQPPMSLVALAQAIERANLSLADVAEHVQENPHAYNRALVARRDHYELLVMTWRPGQASVPHDHAGSICIMQVLQGTAFEGAYRVAPDGYVDLEYESAVQLGEVTAGQDAGVHTVVNKSPSELLVTLHAYAPPLSDFRRFVARQSPEVVTSHEERRRPTVVVVGGGFSGAMTAAQIIGRAREARSPVRVVLVERRGTIGEGLAYGTRELCHLLNVPAGRMSAWPDRPDDFVRWVSQRHGAALPTEFLPRTWYGEYVRETLLETARQAGDAAELEIAYDEVRRVGRHPTGGWMVHLARGSSLCADAIVLAVGHRAPSDPIGGNWSGPRARFIADPWRQFAMNPVNPDESAVVLGCGLTAIDTVLSMAHPTRNAPITLLSRRGLLPQAHAEPMAPPVDLRSLVDELLAESPELSVLKLLRRLRAKAAEVTGAGGDWRSVVDGLRPHTSRLWAAMPRRQRAKFLNHLRAFWEVHRHRMATAVAAQFQELRDRGLVQIVAGRIVAAHAETDEVRLIVGQRESGRLLVFSTRWVVNCTGPVASNSPESNPAIGSLLVHDWLHPDELGLGVRTTSSGQALSASGDVVDDVYVVGTLRKPELWETTAVPELRAQAAQVAAQVVDSFVARRAASSAVAS